MNEGLRALETSNDSSAYYTPVMKMNLIVSKNAIYGVKTFQHRCIELFAKNKFIILQYD